MAWAGLYMPSARLHHEGANPNPRRINVNPRSQLLGRSEFRNKFGATYSLETVMATAQLLVLNFCQLCKWRAATNRLRFSKSVRVCSY
jgi:hypothetical protein